MTLVVRDEGLTGTKRRADIVIAARGWRTCYTGVRDGERVVAYDM